MPSSNKLGIWKKSDVNIWLDNLLSKTNGEDCRMRICESKDSIKWSRFSALMWHQCTVSQSIDLTAVTISIQVLSCNKQQCIYILYMNIHVNNISVHFETVENCLSLPQPSILIFWMVSPEHKWKCFKGELCVTIWYYTKSAKEWRLE